MHIWLKMHYLFSVIDYFYINILPADIYMEKPVQLYRGLIERIKTDYLRHLHTRVDWNNRLTAIVGARGTGKTTLILQHIKLNRPLNETLYVNADDFYFAGNKLLDLASTFWINGGKFLYIDEIHKYPQWSK